jgi:hypothetical protein
MNLEDPTEEICLDEYEGQDEPEDADDEEDDDEDHFEFSSSESETEEAGGKGVEVTPTPEGLGKTTQGDPDSFLITEGGENADDFPEEEEGGQDPDFNIYEGMR